MGAAPAVGPLLTELEQRARSEIDARRAQARAEAVRLAAEGEARRAARRATALADCQRLAEAAAAPDIARASREALRTVLEAQHALIARVFDGARALAKARAEGKPPGPAVLSQRIAATLAYSADEDVELRCPPAWVDALSAIASPEHGRVIGDATVGTGVRARARGGTLIVDDTIEMRLARARPAMAMAICRWADEATQGGGEGAGP